MIILRRLICLILFCVLSASALAEKPAPHYWIKYDKAETLLESRQYQAALTLFKELIEEHGNFHVYLNAAKAASLLEKPQEALGFYKKAYEYAKQNNSLPHQRVALFGIGKMYLWLDQPKAAYLIYKKLLSMKLNAEDQKIAEEGLKKASPAKKPKKIVYKAPPETHFDYAKRHLKNERAEHALAHLNKYRGKKDAHYYILRGKVYSHLEKPKRALACFEAALHIAHNEEQKRVALFGMGAMQLWLEHYEKAEVTYDTLLKMKLNKTDHEIALSGKIRSLSNQDFPLNAYKMVPDRFVYTQPIMVIAVAQALDWSGLNYKSHALMVKYHHLLQKISVQSYLRNYICELVCNNSFAAHKNSIFSHYYQESDTDGFLFNRARFGASRHFTPNSTTFGSYMRGNYQLNGQKVYVNQATLSHQAHINDHLFIHLSGSFTDIEDWHPFIWYAGFIYSPNSYIHVTLYNQNEYVEAVPSLINHISLNTTHLNLFAHPISRLFLSASGYHQHFSDNNNRNGGMFRLIVVVSRYLGLQAEGRFRFYRNSQFNSPNYFSPETLEEPLFLLRFRRKISPFWRAYIEGGIGSQIIKPNGLSPTISQPAKLFEVGFNGCVFEHLLLNIYVGYSDQAIESTTGFARRYGGARLVLPFD